MKKIRKTLSLLLVFCMVFALTPASTLEAAKINSTNASIYVGASQSLKVTGTTKKVTWKSSTPSVATVKSTGKYTAKVTGKKAGVTTVTGKVNGKTYRCKVTVKKKVTTSLSSKITYQAYKTDKNLVIIFKNTNTSNVYFRADVNFYDKAGKILSTASGYNNIFQKGKSCVLTFNYPKNADYDAVAYSNYKVKITAQAPSTIYGSCVSNVSINSNTGSNGGVIAECVNTGSKEINYIYMTCVYYKDGEVIGTSNTYGPMKLKAGDSGVSNFSVPYNSNYSKLEFDKYKIYVDYAYYYK